MRYRLFIMKIICSAVYYDVRVKNSKNNRNYIEYLILPCLYKNIVEIYRIMFYSIIYNLWKIIHAKNLLEKGGEMMKKVMCIIFALCMLLMLPLQSYAASASSTLTTLSKQNVAIQFNVPTKSSMGAGSTASTSMKLTQVFSSKLVYRNVGGKEIEGAIAVSVSLTSKTLSHAISASQFKTTSNGIVYTGNRFKGDAKCTFKALKVPEASEVSKQLLVKVPS